MPDARPPIGLVGASSHTNLSVETERTVNLYPEANGPNAKAPVSMFSTPGLLLVDDLADTVTSATELRGFHVMNDRLFIIAGDSIVERRTDGTNYVWGTLPTVEGPVVLSDNNGKLVVGDGAGFHVLDPTTATVTQITDGVDPIRGWFSGYLDGLTLYLAKDSDQFYWSALDDPLTVDGLAFATAEGNPDPAVAMFVVNREIVFLGTASTEFWGPTGNSDNPVQRILGGFQERGCAARWGAKPFADVVIYIGQDKDGFAQVYLQGPAGGSSKPISNHGVERDVQIALRDYDGEDIRCYSYTEPGHKFAVFNLPNDVTWVYDVTTDAWHERAEIDAETGLLKRIRQDFHAFWNGEHYVGGQASTKLYIQSRRYFDLAGEPLLRQRTTPVIWASGQRMRVNDVRLSMQVAVGLPGIGQGDDPKVMLQCSRDGGYKFDNEITRRLGKIGETLTEVRFGPQGTSVNGFVWRIGVSDPVAVTLVGGDAGVTVG